MKKKWDIYIPRILAMPLFLMLVICCIFKSSAQECPILISPLDGADQVSINTTISWETVVGVPGYIISLGTTPDGRDILNEQNVGASNSYTPTLGLPENTEIFVTITLFFFNRQNIVCNSQSFRTASLSEVPGCTLLKSPLNNAININTATNISWNSATGATGYFLTIGTSLNGNEIANNIDIGNTLSYNPIVDLPAETGIFVTVIPYNRIGVAIGCSTAMFTTAPIAVLPICTSLITPFNGETNIPLSPTIAWNEVPNATGYRVSIGTSPFETNILADALFFKTSTMVIDFEPNRTFFITIIPFNDAGEAQGCIQETFSTIVGCGPYFEPMTGELIVWNPKLTFPDTIGICLDRDTNLVSATDDADGYRWFKVDTSGNETLISSAYDVNLTSIGEYIYEAYNYIDSSENTLECSTSKIFQVKASEAAVINNIVMTEQENGIDIAIEVSGTGTYDYALDDINGPYQDSNLFSGVASGNHTVFVRDINGCGITQELIEQDSTMEGFPKFFTPNGDGINDFWQFIPAIETQGNPILSIWIFDRYGTFLAQIEPDSNGWNGMLNGSALPESNYWFKAISKEDKEIKGHFSLKR